MKAIRTIAIVLAAVFGLAGAMSVQADNHGGKAKAKKAAKKKAAKKAKKDAAAPAAPAADAAAAPAPEAPAQ